MVWDGQQRAEKSGVSFEGAARREECSSSTTSVTPIFLPALAHAAFVQVTRPSEPWEFSDGAVYLVRELCFANPDKGVVFFEEMADVARLTHFVQADCLRETIWKQVSSNEARVVARCIRPLMSSSPVLRSLLVPVLSLQVCM